MRRAASATLLAAFLSSSFGGAAQKSSQVWWPQFRGPNSSGLGAGIPPVHFGPNQNVLWKTAVGLGLSSPVVWDTRIFLTEFDPANKRLSTLCIERRTGKILWRRTVAPEQIEKVHELSSPAGPTPATTLFGKGQMKNRTLKGPRSSMRTTRRASWPCARAARVK